MKKSLWVMVLLVGILVSAFGQNTEISQQRALEIARNFLTSFSPGYADLSHAFTITRNNRLVWDIEFWRGNTEFEFYIDAFTGEIVGFEMEIHSTPPVISPSPNMATQNPRSSPQHPLTVPVARAHEIAIGVVGGGTVRESGLGFYQGSSVHQLEIEIGSRRFQVFVTTDTGEIVRLRSR